MSIIERVADLLSQADPSPIKRSNQDSILLDKGNAIERTFIEDAKSHHTSSSQERLEPVGRVADLRTWARPERVTGDAPATFRTNRQTSPAGSSATFQSVEIDRAHLRRMGMVQPDGERTPVTECFRLVKSQLLANLAKAESKSTANIVMVTSPMAGEGKTFCATNLAISIAQERDYSVLLVDADVILPSVPKMFGIETEQGLMDVLLDQEIGLAQVLLNTDIKNLSILPAGSANRHATELLASDRMRLLIKEMAEKFDNCIIIFDSPPLLAASESSVLASHMGQIVVVAEAGKTTEGTLKAALDRIDSGKITSLLLNKGESPQRGYYYGSYGAR